MLHHLYIIFSYLIVEKKTILEIFCAWFSYSLIYSLLWAIGTPGYLILDFKEWPIMGRKGTCIYETIKSNAGWYTVIIMDYNDQILSINIKKIFQEHSEALLFYK